MKSTESTEYITLDELSEMILSDCRKLGADEEKIAYIQKSLLVKTPESDTSEGYHFTYDQELHSYWHTYYDRGKASAGNEDISPLNFRFKFVRDFILHNPMKNSENKEKWETFLRQTSGCFSTAADYQMTVQECLWQIPGFVSPEPYKSFLPWMGNAVPVGSEQTQTSNKEELYKLGGYRPRLMTHYKGELYTIAEDNSSEQWRAWNRGEIMLYRADKDYMHVPPDELEDVLAARFEVRLTDREDWFPVTSVWRPRTHTAASYDPETEVCCLIADPEYKLPFHTPTSERNYGALLKINLNQVAEVRLWLGKPVIDLLKTTPQSKQNAIEEPVREGKEKVPDILTSEETSMKTIREEEPDKKFDSKMNTDYAHKGSIPLNRQEVGSYELPHAGERDIDVQTYYQDPFKSFSTTPQWVSGSFLSVSSEDKKEMAIRKEKAILGAVNSVELDQVRDSSLQELFALWGGTSDTRPIAKYHNCLYIPHMSQDKIELWRDGVQINTVSPNEIEEIYAMQFEVQYQGEWFLCFGVSAIEYDDGSRHCLLADPKYKLSIHTQASHYMWGDGVEINSSQIEAVRIRLGVLPIDIIVQGEADI